MLASSFILLLPLNSFQYKYIKIIIYKTIEDYLLFNSSLITHLSELNLILTFEIIYKISIQCFLLLLSYILCINIIL